MINNKDQTESKDAFTDLVRKQCIKNSSTSVDFGESNSMVSRDEKQRRKIRPGRRILKKS